MIRQLGLVKFKAEVSAERRAAWAKAAEGAATLPQVQRSSLGPAQPPSTGWDYVWCNEFRDRAGIQAWLDTPHYKDKLAPFGHASGDAFESFDRVYHDAGGVISSSTAASVTRPIHRLMFFRFNPGTPQAKIAEVEALVAELPKRIPSIRNWYLARTLPDLPLASAWTHVWEQDFEDEAGLAAYGSDAFHVAEVVPYFRGPAAVAQLTLGAHRPAASFLVQR